MKILFVNSFYTALESSFTSSKWHPRGMPAYTKLLESLNAKNIPFDVFFMGSRRQRNLKVDKVQQLKELNGNFIFNFPFFQLPKNRVMFRIRLFIDFLRSIFCSLLCYKLCLKNKYDVVYCDRANVLIGAILVTFFRKKVFLRVHGAIDHYSLFENPFTKWLHPARYFSFKASFKICLRFFRWVSNEKFF